MSIDVININDIHRPKIGEIWRHPDGSDIEILDIALSEPDRKGFVVFRRVDDCRHWICDTNFVMVCMELIKESDK